MLREREAFTFIADPSCGRDLDLMEANLAVARPARAGFAHDGEVSYQLEARRVSRHDELRRAPMGRRLRVRDRHDDREGGSIGAAREPLVAVDHVGVSLATGPGPHPHRVGAWELRFGHPEAAAQLAQNERAKPTLFLLVAALREQELHVAGIRRLTVADEVTEDAAPQRFADRAELEEAQSRSAPGAGEVGNEQAQRSGADAESRESWRRRRESLCEEEAFEWRDFVGDEARAPLREIAGALRVLKVHGQGPLVGEGGRVYLRVPFACSLMG
jgi:hypothetical protein